MSLDLTRDIAPHEFVREYWQQAPCLFTACFPDSASLIDLHTLLELAAQDQVESRLVHSHDGSYSVEDGPFESLEQLFTSSADSGEHHSLLVQSVNLWHSGVRQLLKSIHFLPQWRIDDIMISLSTDTGGVGPHVDQYDVFLVQLTGKKRWQIGEPNAATNEVESELRQVEPFPAKLDVELASGDCLYVPANTAHHGTAIGTGMTLSIGFRAPARAELCMMLGETFGYSNDHYIPDSGQEHTGYELTKSDLQVARETLINGLSDEVMAEAYGCLQTQPKQELLLEPCEHSLSEAKEQNIELAIDPAARVAYQVFDEQLHLFVNGELHKLPVNNKAELEHLLKSHYSSLDSSNLLPLLESEDLFEALATSGFLGLSNH